MKIAEEDQRHRDDDEVDQERDHAPRQHALEQLRLGGGIIGVRLEVDGRGRSASVRSQAWSWSRSLRIAKVRRICAERKGVSGAQAGDGDGAMRGSRIVRAMRWLRFAVLLLPLLVAGCGRVTDCEQLRLCRLVPPVLHPGRDRDPRDPRRAGAARPSPACASITRRASRARPAGRISSTCGFGGTTFERDRLDLVAVETDEGALGEARLLYLKRFWLAKPSARAARRRPRQQDLPRIPARRGLRAAAAHQRARARRGLCAARDRLFADLRAGRADQSGVRRDRGARRLRGDRRRRGGGRARRRRCRSPASRSPSCSRRRSRRGWSLLVGRVVVAPLHARHRLGQPILIATAAVALTVQEFLRISQGARERWTPPVFNQPIALARAGRIRRHRHADADRGRAARARGGVRRAAAARAHALRPRLARLRGRSRHGRAVRRRRQAAARRDVPARRPARRARRLDRRGLLRQHVSSRWARCSA